MKIGKIIAVGLAALMLCIPMTSCSNRGEAPKTTLTANGKIDTSPVKLEAGTDYTALAAEKLDAVETAPESDFNYITANGVARITAYIGSSANVRVPNMLGNATVTSIADGAFASHTEIVSLILPDTLRYIGKGILTGCTSLQYLQTALMGADAQSEQFLGYLFGADTHEDNPRDVPPSLSLLVISGDTATISDYALFDCNDLCAVILPESTRAIGRFAFYHCTRLKAVVGLEQLNTVDEYAFADCTGLTALTFGRELISIGYAALLGCNGLVSLTLPFIGGSATENTYLGYIFGAEYVDFSKGYYPPALARVELLSGCTAIGNNAFFECKTLKEIVLPEGLTTIGARAFYKCTALWCAEMPNTLKTIREAAFFGCTSLIELSFGSKLTQIGTNAFYQCVSLPAVTLPDSLTRLPASCFADCISLKAVTLGGVRSVGAQAFRGCSALKTVHASADVKFEEGNDYAEKALQ